MNFLIGEYETFIQTSSHHSNTFIQTSSQLSPPSLQYTHTHTRAPTLYYYGPGEGKLLAQSDTVSNTTRI